MTTGGLAQPWLSGVPKDWERHSLKYLLRRQTLRGRPELELLSVYRDYGVVPKDSRDDNFNRASEDLSNYLVVRRGNVVVNKMKAWQGSVAVSEHVGIVSPAYFVFSFTRKVVPRFAHYLLRCDHFRQDFEKLSSGVRPNQWDLDVEAFGRLQAALPALLRQRAIADFLDRKTAAIDALIAKKEHLIELLQEKRQALITQAVTKGLDPNVPMKESGVEWLGLVPSHWKIVRVSYVADVCNGATPDRSRTDYWGDGTVPWLSSGKVNDYVVKEANEFITQRALRETSVRVLPAGTVLVGMVGQGKTRGMSAFMALDACINQNVAGVTPRTGTDGRYLHHVFVTAYQPLREFGRGGQQDALNCDIIKSFRIPLPPLDVQQRIARLLDAHHARTSKLSDMIERHVEKFREYRQALITAAVTGKIDVSKEAA